ncbi:MAG: ribosome maturation factor RimP [Geminicoccaceae bacterium]|nr:MAG: ribosome maturation factor RimP [Geminicoccaceae bacterium]
MTRGPETETKAAGGRLEDSTAALLRPSLEAMGYELVRVSLGGQSRRTLQVMVERQDRATMTVEHCAEVSHAVSAILDVEDPISGAYDLEVSSPGLDRPLTRPEHLVRFKGFEARLELVEPVDGQRRFKGRIADVETVDGAPVVVLVTEHGPVRLAFASVRKAKLVMNEALLAAARGWAEAGRSP